MKKGFSLIEAVIASGILAMVAGASLALSINVIHGSQLLANRTQALYLAAEGLEVAQNVRDTNYIDENTNTVWNSGLDNGDYGVISNGVRWLLNSSFANQSITPINSTVTFKRTITISTLGTGKQIISKVTWDNNAQNITLATYLADSRQQL